jgi:hypothetical protein
MAINEPSSRLADGWILKVCQAGSPPRLRSEMSPACPVRTHEFI